MTEALVLKGVLNKLETLQMTGDVIWFSRLNSGKACMGKSWIQLCKAGTPDVIAVIRRYDITIAVLFIECKRSGVKKLSFEQQGFFNRMYWETRIYCTIINDPKQLHIAIQEVKIK